MIHHIWFILMSASVLYGAVRGAGKGVLEAALNGCAKALTVTVELCAGYLFFCGLMQIARALRVEHGMQKLLSPILCRLMPHIQLPETRGAVALNLSMNVLGMGNAATPAGLEAMRCMAKEGVRQPLMRHDMEMLLILNATSLQLLPTTVLAMRVSAGSADVNAVLIPTIACTAFSTLTGVLCGLLCRKWKESRYVC